MIDRDEIAEITYRTLLECQVKRPSFVADYVLDALESRGYVILPGEEVERLRDQNRNLKDALGFGR